MRKSGIILASAICFDLGVMIVSSQAAETVHLYLKGAAAVAACVQNGGSVIEYKDGEKYCETTKPGAPTAATPAPAKR